MKITIVTGSRADYGLLEWPIKTMKADPFFEVEVWTISYKLFPDISSDRQIALNYALAMRQSADHFEKSRPDLIMVLGDRHEIMAATTAAYLQRIPIAHIGGGDVTEGSYDDGMRDCISRLASVHFVTSSSAMARLTHMGCKNIHLVGSPGIDYIRKADWKKESPIPDPYVVVSYQAETLDGEPENQFESEVLDRLLDSQSNVKKFTVFIMPNPDRGNEEIRTKIITFVQKNSPNAVAHENFPHDEFLNLIYHCEEFIGNSSAMLYEAPELGIKTRMIGKRQRGRTIPWGDGNASERIVHALKYGAL